MLLDLSLSFLIPAMPILYRSCFLITLTLVKVKVFKTCLRRYFATVLLTVADFVRVVRNSWIFPQQWSCPCVGVTSVQSLRCSLFVWKFRLSHQRLRWTTDEYCKCDFVYFAVVLWSIILLP